MRDKNVFNIQRCLPRMVRPSQCRFAIVLLSVY